MNPFPPVDLLRIVLPENIATALVRWYAFDAQHAMVSSGSALLNNLPAHKHLQLILPAALLAGHIVPAPAHAGRHAASIATQALEDTLLGTKEDAHITLGQAAGTGRVAWVYSKDWLTQVQASLATTQLHPDSAHAEYDLLPRQDDPAIMAGSKGYLFATADGQTGSMDDLSTLRTLLGNTASLLDGDLLSRPLQAGSANLLTGAFAPRHRGMLTLQQFRRSAWLAFALASALLLGAIIHWQQLAAREIKLKNEIRQTFAAQYPGITIIDPVLQWESKQREMTNGGSQRDALDNLSQFANTLGAGIQPRSAEYRDGVIRLLLSETDVATLRPKLEASKREFNVTPAEPGFSRLEIRAGIKS